jgi:TolB-like protein
MSFWGELKRRNVVRVGIAYLAVAWLLIQVADTVFPNLGAPAWVIRALIFASALGFPVALLLAWFFDYTPEGIKPASEVAATKAVGFTGRRIDFVIIGVLVLAVGFLLGRPPGTEPTPIPLIPDSIAVLPLDNLSPDPDNAFYALGIYDEIITQLRKVQNLAVISRESVMALAGEGRLPADIAADLRVESLLTGSLQFADGRIRLRVNLLDPPTGRIIWGRDYQELFADIFAVQADIAMNVANELAVEFSTTEREEIERPYTESEDAHTYYLAAQAARDRGERDLASELIDKALEADPTFVEAWIARSGGYSFFGEYERAWEAAQTAIARSEGEDPRAYAAQGVVRTYQGRWIEAEEHFRDAVARGLEPSDFLGPLALHIIVGRFDEAIAEAEAHLEVDPMNRFSRHLLLQAYERVGDQDGWQRTLDRGEVLYGEGRWFVIGYTGMLIALAERDHEYLRSLAAEASAGDPIDAQQKAINLGVSNLESPTDGLAALRALHDELDLSSSSAPLSDRTAIFSLSAWAAFFGDSEQAFEWLAEAMPLSPITLSWTWLPIFDSVRQEPGFEQLLTDLRLPEYWDMYGWSEMCQRISDDEFMCD